MSELSSDFAVCRGRLLERLKEPAPGRIQLLTGPRQVGKTTLLLEITAQFGDAAVYAAGDEPDAALPFNGMADLAVARHPAARFLGASLG
jgi:AAA domain